MAARILSARGRTLDLSSPKIMGILNVTPDSFSDGGKFVGLESEEMKWQLAFCLQEVAP